MHDLLSRVHGFGVFRNAHMRMAVDSRNLALRVISDEVKRSGPRQETKFVAMIAMLRKTGAEIPQLLGSKDGRCWAADLADGTARFTGST
jgi:hypothetical protein